MNEMRLSFLCSLVEWEKNEKKRVFIHFLNDESFLYMLLFN